jgi:hypothetical protein
MLRGRDSSRKDGRSRSGMGYRAQIISARGSTGLHNVPIFACPLPRLAEEVGDEGIAGRMGE